MSANDDQKPLLFTYVEIVDYRESNAFAEQNIMELITDQHMSMFEDALARYKENADVYSTLVRKQADLVRLATYTFFNSEWPGKRALLLNGFSWLLRPEVDDYLDGILSDYPHYKELVAGCRQLIRDYAGGDKQQILRSLDLARLIPQIEQTDGWDRVDSLNAAISIAKDVDRTVHGGLLIDLGDTLSQLVSLDQHETVGLAIQCYRQALPSIDKALYPEHWARLQHHMGIAYRKYRLGNIADNIEFAIDGLNNALTVYTMDQYPEKWADLQNSLGNCYCDRIRGEKSDNLQKAIESYQDALKVYTIESSPVDWAMTQNNLGTLYSERARGDRSQNLEDAILAFQNALLIRTRENFPFDWAMTMDNLGNAYYNRINGVRAQNIEDAIDAFQQSLLVRTKERFPMEWAFTKSHLASAYTSRIKGDRAQNIEDAIDACSEALTVYSVELSPKDWAGAHTNLGGAYQDRVRGKDKENLEKSMAAFKQSLTVFSREDFPFEWALAQMNIGALYSSAGLRNTAQNGEESIHALQNALSVFTKEQYPRYWAMTHMNLGSSLRSRVSGDKAENERLSIDAFQRALEVYTRESDPYYWAIINSSMGASYFNLKSGDYDQHMKMAEQALLQALEIFTSEQFPEDFIRDNRNLGDLYHSDGQLDKARVYYERAHHALELMRAGAITSESRKKMAQDNFAIYFRLVECCMAAQDIEFAVFYAMLAKSRTLAEQLAGEKETLDELLQNNPQLREEYSVIEKKQEEVMEISRMLEASSKENSSILRIDANSPEAKRLTGMQKEINRLTDDLIFKYPSFAAVQSLPLLTLQEAQLLALEMGGIPLVEFFMHSGGWCAFVILPGAVHYVFLGKDIEEQIGRQVSRVHQAAFWVSPDWRDVLAELYLLLFAPVKAYLPESGPVVLSLTSFLYFVPFQALLDESGRYASEDYAFSFVPGLTSLRVLMEEHRQRKKANSNLLLNVAYPGFGKDFLNYVLPEAESVKSQFLQSVLLYDREATVENVIQQSQSHAYETIHFSCHAGFDFNNPFQSGLFLANGKRLTIDDIRLRMRLDGYPLVTLSACQTGTVAADMGDESVGLSWAFLTSGASAVLSSLWAVNDASTSELFHYFYRIRRKPDVSNAEALRQTMRKLREEYDDELSPFYWAAFQVTGLPLV